MEDVNRIAAAASFSASVGPGNANAAIYIPCRFPISATVTGISFRPTNGTGNYDFGLYSATFARIASKGSTAMSDAQVDLAISNYRICAGGTLWVALALSSTAGRFAAYSLSSAPSLITAGCLEQASALALPDPGVPATVSSWLHIPIFSFTLA